MDSGTFTTTITWGLRRRTSQKNMTSHAANKMNLRPHLSRTPRPRRKPADSKRRLHRLRSSRGRAPLHSIPMNIRAGTTADALSELKPAFSKDGTVTAGNASGINDGAAAVMMMSARKASELGLKPLAWVRAYSSAGVDPKIMGMGPVPASQLCLKKAGWTHQELDLME